MVWHVWKWTQWLGLMTLWEPKVGIMSWKRHILDKPTGMVMEQTAGVRAQCWEISKLDLDLMDFSSVHLRLMKPSDSALQPTFPYTLQHLECNVKYQSLVVLNMTTKGIFYSAKLCTFVAVHVMGVLFPLLISCAEMRTFLDQKLTPAPLSSFTTFLPKNCISLYSVVDVT